jgi:sirohydrochlorin ferrochelatase
MEDIPHEIEQAQEALAGLTVEVCPDLGSHPKLRQVLQSKRRVAGDGALLLLAHGSRRPGGNAKIHSLAEALGGTAAFWAVAPKLEDQVIQLMQAGRQQLIVLPYFLFPGKITDAITHAAEELAERFPQMTLRLLPPLGPTESLANLVTDLALDRVRPNTQTSTLTLNRTAFRHQLPPFMVS